MSGWIDGPVHTVDVLERKKKTVELVLDDEEENEITESYDIQPTKTASKTNVVPTNEYIDDMIREFFRIHGITSALEAFDKERPTLHRDNQAIEAQDKELMLHSLNGESRLEAFVKEWNKTEHGIEMELQPKKIKKSKKEKPNLSIESTTADVPETTEPFSFDLGVPGCTPKPRLQDLKSFGFDDIDDIKMPIGTMQPLTIQMDRIKTHSKKVTIGEEGATPKKEYFFYRETPPSFVTESEEAAREIMEKLSHDPAYEKTPAITQPKLVELSSSDVGKYEIGKRVEGLGANREISGIITKKYGSKQCGLSGPGTIVIDTQPEIQD